MNLLDGTKILNIKKVFVKLMNLFNRIRMSELNYAKYIGVNVGENCRFEGRSDFGTEPYLIKIGSNVSITSTTFITHDGAVWLLRKKYPECDYFGPISIGDNVFIGYKTIILPGINIGSNVIIGAGSIVTKNIPDGEVWCGVPARCIKNTLDYENEMIHFISMTKSFNPSQKKEYLIRKFYE